MNYRLHLLHVSLFTRFDGFLSAPTGGAVACGSAAACFEPCFLITSLHRSFSAGTALRSTALGAAALCSSGIHCLNRTCAPARPVPWAWAL